MTPFTSVELAAIPSLLLQFQIYPSPEGGSTVFHPGHDPCNHTDGDRLGPLQPQPVRNGAPGLASGQNVSWCLSPRSPRTPGSSAQTPAQPTGSIRRHTHAVSRCYLPVCVVARADGEEPTGAIAHGLWTLEWATALSEIHHPLGSPVG